MSKTTDKKTEVKEEEAKAPEKEVAKTPETSKEVSTTNTDIDFASDAGTGQEDMGADDIQIPRMNIIQSLSPQRVETKPEYIADCKEGQIFENGGKELFDGKEGVLVVPIMFQKSYLEWAPRNSGKGLVKHHGNDGSVYNSITPNEKYQRITGEGNEIIPTAEYFVYLVDKETGAFRPFVLSMSKSALKHAKRWNLMINQLTAPRPDDESIKNWNAPIFFGVYNLSTLPETNNEGNWYRWEVKAAGTIKQFENTWTDLYKSAQAFRKSIQEGGVKVREPADHDAGGAGTENDDDPM